MNTVYYGKTYIFFLGLLLCVFSMSCSDMNMSTSLSKELEKGMDSLKDLEEIESHTCIISFDTKGGNALSDIVRVVGRPIVNLIDTQAPPEPVKKNRIFKGWCKNDEYPLLWELKTRAVPDTALIVKALWHVPYRVEHYLQNIDSTDFTLSAEHTENNSINEDEVQKAVSAVPLNLSGFTYDGSISASKNNILIAEDGSSVLRLYYTRNAYTVVFDSSGGTGTMSPMAFKWGESKNLSRNAFTENGLSFVGWFSGAGLSYTDGQLVSNMTAENNASIILYAQWAQVVFNIVYNLDGGENHPTNPATYTGGTSVVLQDPTRCGYDFGGWVDADTEMFITEIGSGSSGDKVLRAIWNPISYRVDFVSGDVIIQSATYNIIFSPQFPTPVSISGKTFAGWFDSVDGSGSKIDTLLNHTGNIRLYAQWTGSP